VLEALSRGLTQKMLHGTLTALHTGDTSHREATAQTVSKLFLRGQARAQADDAEH
jgi:glutamyl-tRNA reductase